MDQKIKFLLPLVSVIIPTYNRCEFVPQAIDSVLDQTYKDIEIIVVDDGSTDGTADVLKTRYGDKIQYVRQENKGGPIARNLGISLAKGKYIALLDSDDLWMPEKLACQVPVLEENPDIAVVICQVWQIDNNGQKISEQPLGKNTKPSDFSIENLLMYNTIPAGASTSLIRRSALEKAGGFSQDIHFGAEWDLWLRMAVDSIMVIVPEPLASYRKHKQTLTFYPSIKYVDDTLADRLIMLERCINNFPEKISKSEYQKAVAYQYTRAAFASILLQDKERGKIRLNKVLELCPDFWKGKEDFSEQVNVFSDGYSFDQNGKYSPDMCLAFVDLLCSSLPEVLNRKDWISLTQGKVRMEVGFHQYKNGEREAGLRQILKAVLWAPQLMNLAVLAVFVELILGRNIVNSLRALRHKEHGKSS